jgi:hypothetical protein
MPSLFDPSDEITATIHVQAFNHRSLQKEARRGQRRDGNEIIDWSSTCILIFIRMTTLVSAVPATEIAARSLHILNLASFFLNFPCNEDLPLDIDFPGSASKRYHC